MEKKVGKKRNERVLRGVKGVSKLAAQSDSKCGLVDELELAYSTLLRQLDSIKLMGIELYAVARLQAYHGLRISEVLSITGNNIDRIGAILVPGKKGSNDRKVVDTELVTWWTSKRLLGSSKVFEFDRYYVHRVYLKCGINYMKAGSMYHVTTHYMRHLFIKSSQSQTQDIESTARIVGHKASSNTKRYLKSRLS